MRISSNFSAAMKILKLLGTIFLIKKEYKGFYGFAFLMLFWSSNMSVYVKNQPCQRQPGPIQIRYKGVGVVTKVE